MDTGFSSTENRDLKKRQYTEEFKKDAVRFIVLEGESVASVAERLGVSASLVYGWKKSYLKAVAPKAAGKGELTLEEAAAEIERLRRELGRERRANEILKKTVGFFARDET